MTVFGNIFHRDITFLCQIPVEHQFAMPQVVKHWPKVCGVSVYEIGTSFILKSRKEDDEINTIPMYLLAEFTI